MSTNQRKPNGDELAERHQVVLVVAVRHRAVLLQPHHRVGVALGEAAQRDADQRRGLALREMLLARLPIARRQLLRQQRDGRLGGDDQVAGGAVQLVGVPVQHARQVVGGELLVLRHVALQQGHGQRPGGHGEVVRDGRHHHAQQQRGDQRHPFPRPRAGAGEPGRGGGDPGRDEADAVDPGEGRERRQRPLDMGIARGHPRKAGEQHAPRQLGQQPGRGEHQRRPQPGARGQAHVGCHGQREVQRQEPGQQQHRQRGQPGRQAAVAVHADEQPPGAAGQPGGAEQPAQQGGAPRRGGAVHAPGEHRQRHQLHGPGAHVRKGQRVGGAGQQGNQQVRTGPHQPSAIASAATGTRVTLNHRTAPARDSMTEKRRPAMSTTSPRRGTCPSSCAM